LGRGLKAGGALDFPGKGSICTGYPELPRMFQPGSKMTRVLSSPPIARFAIIGALISPIALRGAASPAASGSPAALPALAIRGVLSPDSENANQEADPAYIPHLLAPPFTGGVPRILSPGQARLAEMPNAREIATAAAQMVGGKTIHVALLGQHKYMINDCLGVKVSVGEFDLKLGSPTIAIQDAGVVASFSIDRISFTAFKLRFRPDLTDVVEPCHFSGSVALGGEADNIVVELRYNPVIDTEHCTVGDPGRFEFDIKIGRINLGPVPPGIADLENPFKDMVTDAMNDCFSLAEQITGGSTPVPALLKDMTMSLNEVLSNLCHQTAGRVASAASGPVASALGSAASSATNAPGTNMSGAAGAGAGLGTAPAVSAAGVGPVSPGIAGGQSLGSGEGSYETTTNPSLSGRLGRLVISFPAEARHLSVRTRIFKAGGKTSLKTADGSAVIELLPGSYDIEVNGLRVPSVAIASGQDTRLRAGVLRLTSSTRTRFSVFVPGGKEPVKVVDGSSELGLPAGDVEVDVNGVRGKVTVVDGQIAEF